MFVSEGVSDELGFSPESYVLASEEESVVQADLEKLVDKIAALTQPDGDTSDYQCLLTDRMGESKPYKFDFRLFRPKSSKANLIAVTLHMSNGEGQSAGATGEQKVSDAKFVATSSVMKAVMGKIETLSRQDQHVLLRGERSTGKRTIAEMLARKAAVLKSNTQVWVLDLEEMQSKNDVRLFAGFDSSDSNSNIFEDVRVDLQLVIVELSLLKKSDQKDLLRLIEARAAMGYQTRLIVTSTESIENLQQAGKLETDFLYKTSFISVFIPALRDRVDELGEIATNFAELISGVLGVKVVGLKKEQIELIKAAKWDGNFDELRGEIGRLVVMSGKDSGRDDRRGASSVAGSGTKTPVKKGELLSYDDMARQYLISVLEHTRGKIYGKGGAADILDMKPTTLQSKLKKLNIR